MKIKVLFYNYLSRLIEKEYNKLYLKRIKNGKLFYFVEWVLLICLFLFKMFYKVIKKIVKGFLINRGF